MFAGLSAAEFRFGKDEKFLDVIVWELLGDGRQALKGGSTVAPCGLLIELNDTRVWGLPVVFRDE